MLIWYNVLYISKAIDYQTGRFMGKQAHVIYLIANRTGQLRASLCCGVTMKPKSHVFLSIATRFLNAWRIFKSLSHKLYFKPNNYLSPDVKQHPLNSIWPGMLDNLQWFKLQPQAPTSPSPPPLHWQQVLWVARQFEGNTPHPTPRLPQPVSRGWYTTQLFNAWVPL